MNADLQAKADQVHAVMKAIDTALDGLDHSVSLSALLSIYRLGLLANPCCIPGHIAGVTHLLGELRMAQLRSADQPAASTVH